MAARGDVVGSHGARLHKLFLKVSGGVGGLFGVKRQETGFCRHKNFVSPKAAGGDQTAQRGADGPFASLVSVVDGRIQNIRAHLQGSPDRPLVERILGRGRITEVGS